MIFDFYTILIVAHVILNLMSAYFAYVIYKFNRLSKAWLNVVVGILIIATSGILAFIIQLGVFPESAQLLQFWALVALPFVFSVNLLLGMISMKNNFEKFEILEKQYSERAKMFNKSGKKKKR